MNFLASYATGPPRFYDLFFPSQYIDLDVPPGAWSIERACANGPAIMVSNFRNSYLYYLTYNGSCLSSFRCPKDLPAEISQGTGGDYFAIPNENLIIQLNTAGSIVASAPGPGTRVTCVDLKNLGYGPAGDIEQRKVYFLPSWGYAHVAEPVGVYANWITGDGEQEPIYKEVWVVDKSSIYVLVFLWNPAVAITPASFGRVKALFR